LLAIQIQLKLRTPPPLRFLKKEIRKSWKRTKRQDLILELDYGSLKDFILTLFSLVIKSMPMSMKGKLIVSLPAVLKKQVKPTLIKLVLKKELKSFKIQNFKFPMELLKSIWI
jgi:membrane-anchored glycerophosphoryl diester phosphodiesterase (GDPDase)